MLDFVRYEEMNGRRCDIEADDDVLRAIGEYMPSYDSGLRISPPDLITECTACPRYRGCRTDLVCHTSPLENACMILDSGRLLSPVLARGIGANELQAEPRNAAKDPADYFDYIMFAWGNCQAGDRLVMERKLGRFPNEQDLSDGFEPGVRFFFRYPDLIRHPEAVFDGVLPLKVKNEIVLKDWVHAIIASENARPVLECHVPADLRDRTFYVENNCRDIWEWSSKVYEFARSIKE